ncbi:MAG: ABC transporter permease [Phycisphaeraceae bacterium]|nr:ABC transporter permease [Phycisphaeraceae bacterium]MCB9847504.1 ABC transporter permease [Phycisphaeraceae bacterium]
MQFFLEIVRLGLTNLRLHMLRSILTALGIILGVAAVITMVSIGEGSKLEALARLERLGAKNIIVRSIKPPETGQASGGQQRSFVSRYGLTREDLDVIEASFPHVESITPFKSLGSEILRGDRKRASQGFGVTPGALEAMNLRIARGRYISDADMDERAMVAVLGHEIARALFPLDDPIGNTFRIDQNVLTVVGVLEPVGLAGGAGASLIGRDLNFDTQIPMTTARVAFGDTVVRRESGNFSASEVQIYEIIMTSRDREQVMTDYSILKRLIESRHPKMDDVQLIVPYELLESARKTALTWSLVLGAVAGISLLVGGIGIMNIMLASVTERTREIGIRRALGATRRDVKLQFIVETGVLSSIGGLLGIGLGIGLSLLVGWGVPLLPEAPFIGRMFEQDVSLPTAVTGWSVLLSFSVATLTGLIFGIYPAAVAARQDPIVALRHD